MEGQIKVNKITLKFNSNELNRLKVSLFEQNDQLFQICTLLQNRSHQIELNKKISCIHCAINTPNNTEDFCFQISLQQPETEKPIQRKIQFDEFVIQMQMQMQIRKVSADFSQDQQILADKANLELAKSTLLKIRQKVLLTLTKANFIKTNKRKSRLLTKARVRRSKTKKNLTAIFYRNTSNDLTVCPFKKQQQKSEKSLNSIQKGSKNNDSRSQYSDQSRLAKLPSRVHNLNSVQYKIIRNNSQARAQQKINERKITEKNEQNDEKKWCKKYCNGAFKSKYLRTLQTQTVKQLNTQKQQLQILRMLTSNENAAMIRVVATKEILVQNRTQELKNAYRLVSKSKTYGKLKKQIR